MRTWGVCRDLQQYLGLGEFLLKVWEHCIDTVSRIIPGGRPRIRLSPLRVLWFRLDTARSAEHLCEPYQGVNIGILNADFWCAVGELETALAIEEPRSIRKIFFSVFHSSSLRFCTLQ